MSLWDDTRNLSRYDTATLLVPGGLAALGVVALTYVTNKIEFDRALDHGHRASMLLVGVALEVSAVAALSLLLRWPGDFLVFLARTFGRTNGTRERVRTDEREAKIAEDLNTKFQSAYYVVVAVQVLGFWMLATSTGGFIRSPLGLLFASIILFGQIRGNKRQDILILLAAGIVGVVMSDVITYNRLLPSLFPEANRIKVNPQSWYFAIVLSFLISTWTNWLTFGESSKERAQRQDGSAGSS